MNKTKGRFSLDTVPVLLIFCIFAVSVFITLALGSGIYRRTVEITGEVSDRQTCLLYIWTKVKSADGLIYTESFQGRSALCIEENYGGVDYKTLIYHYDGWVRELFFESGLDFSPADGAPVIEGESLEFEAAGTNLIKASAGDLSLCIKPARGGAESE